MAATASAVPALGVLGRCSWLQAFCWCLVTSPCSVTVVLLTLHSRDQWRGQAQRYSCSEFALYGLFVLAGGYSSAT